MDTEQEYCMQVADEILKHLEEIRGTEALDARDAAYVSRFDVGTIVRRERSKARAAEFERTFNDY